MERSEKIQNIKKLESEFVSNAEGLIKNKYLDLLFDKYKKSVKEIAECYKNPNVNLLDSRECAKSSMEKYLEKEKHFENLFSHYEDSIKECIRLCKFDIKNPILDCYEKCFINMNERLI